MPRQSVIIGKELLAGLHIPVLLCSAKLVSITLCFFSRSAQTPLAPQDNAQKYPVSTSNCTCCHCPVWSTSETLQGPAKEKAKVLRNQVVQLDHPLDTASDGGYSRLPQRTTILEKDLPARMSILAGTSSRVHLGSIQLDDLKVQRDLLYINATLPATVLVHSCKPSRMPRKLEDRVAKGNEAFSMLIGCRLNVKGTTRMVAGPTVSRKSNRIVDASQLTGV